MKEQAGRRSAILAETERIRQIYSDVRQRRTRRVELLGKKCEARILYTFLGFEVKMGSKRVTCPDMVSARYVRLFAELGAEGILMPYDPTHTALVLAGLEPALDRIKELLVDAGMDRAAHQRAVRETYRLIRRGLAETDKDGGEAGAANSPKSPGPIR